MGRINCFKRRNRGVLAWRVHSQTVHEGVDNYPWNCRAYASQIAITNENSAFLIEEFHLIVFPHWMNRGALDARDDDVDLTAQPFTMRTLIQCSMDGIAARRLHSSLVSTVRFIGHAKISPQAREWMSTIYGAAVSNSDTSAKKLTRGADNVDAASLPALAVARPALALDRAATVLRDRPTAADASYAHQAVGIALRDRGELPLALGHLRRALRQADTTRDDTRIADIRATLGATLVMSGRTERGLSQLDEAVALASGLLRATVRMRRAYALRLVGRYEDALADLQVALKVARQHKDSLWEARILNNRSYTYLLVGNLKRADEDAAEAGRLYDELGQVLEAVQASHNRADVASRRGDLPSALRLLDLAAARYETFGLHPPEVIIDRGRALLAAGLAAEAVQTAETALTALSDQPAQRADLLLFAAKAALADDEPERARHWSVDAARLFRRQTRPTLLVQAHFLECQARAMSGEHGKQLLSTSVAIATELGQQHSEDAPLAHLLSARIARARGNHDVAAASLNAAARYRKRSAALTRATGWLAVAMQAEMTGNEQRILSACGHGLDALDEHRLLFGAAELRAVATWHGRDLATFAVDEATRRGSPRLMLEWTERTRATSLAEPSVRPAEDVELQRDLAAVRDATRRLEEATATGQSAALAQQERDKWETAVRDRRRYLTGSFGVQPRFDTKALLGALGDRQLISLVESNGTLHALTAGNGRVRRQEVGPVDAAIRELNFAQFALRRAAHGREGRLGLVAERLQHALLGAAANGLGRGPVIVVPPAKLNSVPWGLLPALQDVPLTVAPSALMWMRAAATPETAERDRRVLLVAGPGLGSRGEEVGHLSNVHLGATMLGADVGVPASMDQVLEAMNGAWIAHLAAHGVFRADSPLFSSLRLDDGPLFVHDFERLDTPPRIVVLSACDSGISAAVGADELLGLVSGLLRIGVTGVLASTVPVNDEAAIPYMLAVHQGLADGMTLPDAALQGRREAADDALAAATAASFSAWGS